jgi:serine/threonine protein kinase
MEESNQEEALRKQLLLGNARCVSDFEKLAEIGEGTYGTVYKARDKASGKVVALKKVRMHNANDGFPITSLREINILSQLKSHPNIIKLEEVVVGYKKDSVFLSFEYCEVDLANLVDFISRKRGGQS